MPTNHLPEHFENFIKECQYSASRRPETIRGYREVFKLFLKIMPEVTALEFLTPDMLVEFFQRIQTRYRLVGKHTIKTGVKNSTIQTQRNKLNVFFNWLQGRGYIKNNPLQSIPSPRVVYEDPKELSKEGIEKIYSAIILQSVSTLLLRRDTMIVSLLLFCGLRKNELISLKAFDIDLSKRELTIRAETSKSARTRILGIHPTLLLHIKEYLQERKLLKHTTEYLIVSNRGDARLTREGLKHWVNSLVKKSGVKFHLHRFRHTFACRLADKDVGAFKIQKMMGHSDISTTMKYARSLRTENMKDDIGKISI